MKMKWFVGLVTAVSVLASASPGFAYYDENHPYPISHERAAALRGCNYMADVVHPSYYDRHNRTAFYRACMYSHGEPE